MTPIIKNKATATPAPSGERGKTPITTNGMISVVNGQGEEIGVTYLKRAKGLIKNGRARRVDDHTIRIQSLATACPPDSEDKAMSEYMNSNQQYDNDGAAIMYKEAQLADKPSVDSIMKSLTEMIKTTDYIMDAINGMANIDSKDGTGGDVAQQIRMVVSDREITNQKIVDLLRKIYEDARPGRAEGDRSEMYRIFRDGLSTSGSEVRKEIMEKLYNNLFN